MGKMTIFHGSYTVVNTPKIIRAKNTKDFGVGFYCTLFREQAQRWAKRYSTSIVNTYTVTFNSDLKILEFKQMSEQWLDFIVACRNGKNHDYDIVIGPMADDQIYNYISDYTDGVITREQFWSLARFKYPTNQITFCTQAALKHLKFEASEEIK